jgi:hypothetical protein
MERETTGAPMPSTTWFRPLQDGEGCRMNRAKGKMNRAFGKAQGRFG